MPCAIATMRALSFRDAFLVVLGVGYMHLVNVFMPLSEYVALADVSLASQNDLEEVFVPTTQPVPQASPPVLEEALIESPKPRPPLAPNLLHQRAPGWTIFDNFCMVNDTLFTAQTDTLGDFPAVEWMTSTGLPAVNNSEGNHKCMPTERNFSSILTADAKRRWGNEADEIQTHLLCNDPDQFLNHFYDFYGEHMFGAWVLCICTLPADTPSVWTRARSPHTGQT
ncbi:hypothetical protein PENSPDRAFT_737022 [Peniophora sp. CONT]|nr:hypothetical protein PENSPDRAFT_737022 [Peniophora sp. CONT]